MKIIQYVTECYHSRKHKVRLGISIGPVSELATPPTKTPQYRQLFATNERKFFMGFNLTDSQQTICTLGYTDKRGNPSPAPAGAQPPVWLVDVPTVLSLTPSADGMSCTVAAVGPLGDAKLSVSVADNAGNSLASGSLDFTVIGGAPTKITVTPGVPTEQP